MCRKVVNHGPGGHLYGNEEGFFFFPSGRRSFEKISLMQEKFWQLETSFFRWQILFSVSRRKKKLIFKLYKALFS